MGEKAQRFQENPKSSNAVRLSEENFKLRTPEGPKNETHLTMMSHTSKMFW